MHSETVESTVCDVCGFVEARIRYTSRTYGKGQDLLVIENVPVVSCPSCGTSYLTSSTLKEIERIKRTRKTVAVTQLVEVASFSVG
ncbi:MAG: type II toxin-antitoxin system MqsA family antitoxin [Symploca sp. SIO1B1]|nr:type II toxin-antitoxin system MqsA family antitoxin [Symploca sp. SIO1B1]